MAVFGFPEYLGMATILLIMLGAKPLAEWCGSADSKEEVDGKGVAR
jgi:hypothetical protein